MSYYVIIDKSARMAELVADENNEVRKFDTIEEAERVAARMFGETPQHWTISEYVED